MTIRINVKDLKAYEKTRTGWKRSKRQFPETLRIIKLFKAQKNLKELIDKKDPKFFKGQLGPKGEVQGARIWILPNGEKLDKAYSLFAKNLKVHDQDSHDHWDVIYQNKGGTYAYCYTLKKKQEHRNRKYNKVQEFDKLYKKLHKKVLLALRDKNDNLALPMYTLLTTYMRVGNEIYYKAHGHKGLTTLKKKDIKISGNNVIFSYLAKDGVPRRIEQKFPKTYIQRLRTTIKRLRPSDFIFPLKEQQFKGAFKRYCGQEFYPHIVRSHFATSEVRRFLKSKRKASKEEVESLYLSIAAKLGHKKFVKKEHQWKDNYTVTVNHYVQPVLVEKVKSITI